jgi:hypothetical protein
MKAHRALIAAILLLLPCSVRGQLVGHWVGTAKVIHTWAYGKTFPVLLDIHRDGTATGTLGNAKLVDARWKRERLSPHERQKYPGWITFLVKGGLSGSLMPKDAINATYAYVPIERYHGKFSGGVNTHGTTQRNLFGTRDQGIMSCELSLRRRP